VKVVDEEVRVLDHYCRRQLKGLDWAGHALMSECG